MHAYNKSFWCLYVVCTHSSIFVVPSTISSSSPLCGPLWWHNSFVSVQAFNRSPLTNRNENESLQSWRDWPCTPCRTNGQCSWALQALLVILLAKSSKMMHPKSCGHRVTAYCWNRLLNRKMTMLFKQPTIVGLSTNWEDQLYVGVHFLADCLCSVLLKQRVLRYLTYVSTYLL